MALADFDQYVAARSSVPHLYAKGAASTSSNGDMPWRSVFHYFSAGGVPLGPGTPSTAEALNADSVGAWQVPRSSTGRMICPEIDLDRCNNTTPFPDYGLLVDRLSHQGGLVGNVTTTQTTNLPTAALTRYTDGVGVLPYMHIYTSVGSNDSTATISYTNHAGTSGRTGTLSWKNTPALLQGQFINLQAGDLGVRSIESFTLSVNTGVAGIIGLTLFKPISFIQGVRVIPIGWGTEIDPGACLEVITSNYHTQTSSPYVNPIVAKFAEV